MYQNKSKILQQTALAALKYLLHYVVNPNTGKLYSQTELADELKVGRALINHIINGRRSLDLSKIEQIEKIAGIELFMVHDPECLKEFEPKPKKLIENKVIPRGQIIHSMEDKLNTFDFYKGIKNRISSKIHEEYNQLKVESRLTSQYVSINIFGNQIRDILRKENLHLLFFRYIEIEEKPLLKIEFMISDDRLTKFVQEETWFNQLNIYHSSDSASVTDFIDGKAIFNNKRPVYKMSELSDPEIDNLAKLSLAVFEIQCGLYKGTI